LTNNHSSLVYIKISSDNYGYTTISVELFVFLSGLDVIAPWSRDFYLAELDELLKSVRSGQNDNVKSHKIILEDDERSWIPTLLYVVAFVIWLVSSGWFSTNIPTGYDSREIIVTIVKYLLLGAGFISLVALLAYYAFYTMQKRVVLLKGWNKIEMVKTSSIKRQYTIR
jgi:hypothetical protein